MKLLIIIAAVALFILFAVASRKRKQRAAVRGLREQFPRIARIRLIAACPGLDGLLDEPSLRLLFDWMLIEIHRRTGTSSFGELMQWSVDNGEARAMAMVSDVSNEAIDRLPAPVLAEIEACGARAMVAVILDEALTEAGRRIGPELNRKYV
jgi:hypothetical protein